MSLSAHLTHLESAGLVSLAAVQPELEYLFRHALVQDAAYASLVKADRMGLHRACAEALEQMYPEKLEEELAGLLAYHFAHAGAREKAVEYSRRAARRAVATYAYDEAVRHLGAALELVGPGDQSESRLVLLEELADAHRLMREGIRAIPLYQRALELWRRRGSADKVGAVRLHRKIVQTLAEVKWSVEVEVFLAAVRMRLESGANLETGLRLMEGEQPHPETVRLLVALSTDAWRVQIPVDWGAAQCYAQSAVELAERLDSPADLSRALGALATVLDARGLLRQHLEVALRRLAVIRDPRADDLHECLDALTSAGMAHMYVGEYEQSMPYLLEAEQLAGRIRTVDQLNTFSLQCQTWFRLDRWDEVLSVEEKWRNLERRYARAGTGPT